MLRNILISKGTKLIGMDVYFILVASLRMKIEKNKGI